MTCIVGVKDKNNVFIGGDCAGVSEDLSVNRRTDPKVFIINEHDDPMIIGYAGSFRMGQLLQYAFTPPERREGSSDMQYLVVDFIKELRDCFKEGGFCPKEEDSHVEVGGFFLLGYRNELYEIQSDFQVARVQDGYAAIGCGEQFALGSLYTTEKYDIDSEQRINLSLEAAEHNSGGVLGPFTVLKI